MATATITVTPQAQGQETNRFFVEGTLAITANPDTYATGGLTLNFALAAAGFQKVKASRVPLAVRVNGNNGWTYAYVPGTTASDGKLKIFTTGAAAQAALVEMTNATVIPATVSGDTINFQGVWRGME